MTWSRFLDSDAFGRSGPRVRVARHLQCRPALGHAALGQSWGQLRQRVAKRDTVCERSQDILGVVISSRLCGEVAPQVGGSEGPPGEIRCCINRTYLTFWFEDTTREIFQKSWFL